MQNYRDIRAWQYAHRVVLRVYAVTETFPASERFGLVSQTRRAAVSVPANIAEGSKRLFKRDYVRFLNVAEASLREVDYYLVLARDLRFVDAQAIAELLGQVEEAARLLAGFRRTVQRSHRDPQLPTPDDTPDS
jgi:four helix bundle protein